MRVPTRPGGIIFRSTLLVLALLCGGSVSLPADDDPPRKMPEAVARVLPWLPEETETLFVGRSVTLTDFESDEARSWQDYGVNLAVGDRGDKDLKRFRGRKIECIVAGAMNFDGVSSFGSLRSERCSILVFKDDLGETGKEWTEDLRKTAKAVRTMVGHEVFVFPSTTVMEPWVKETSWQGTYFVLLKPNIVLCASSDRMLETMLRRINDVPKKRALPDSLPEWKHVDFQAPVWMIRHVPQTGKRDQPVGSIALFMKNSFRVTYIPRTENEKYQELVKAEWLPEKLFETEKSRDQIKIERQPDNTVVVTCDKPLIGENTFLIWFAWQLYRMQAYELFQVR